MGNITLSFTVQGDSEGYVTFECPYCGSEFKLQAGEVQSDEEPVLELFCPYCGLAKEKSAFWSKDVRDKARALAENYMIEELNKAFGKMARSINRQKSIIKTRQWLYYTQHKKRRISNGLELAHRKADFVASSHQ